MAGALFAMPPPQMRFVWPVGFLFVLLTAIVLVTATRVRAKESERQRRAGLGLAAVLFGPLVGAVLAWLANTFGAVNPLDVRYTYAVFTVIGGIAGLLAGIVFGVTGLLCLRDQSGKSVQGKAANDRSAAPELRDW